MTLKEIRITNNLNQKEVASILGIPARTLRRYETNDEYGSLYKRDAFINKISEYCQINEEKGILSIENIKTKVNELFDSEFKGQIDFCYLFGSYAKGAANERSDIDLYVSSSLTGLKLVGLIEKLRQTLNKKIDVLRTSELVNNPELMNEIMKEGIKIYG